MQAHAKGCKAFPSLNAHVAAYNSTPAGNNATAFLDDDQCLNLQPCLQRTPALGDLRARSIPNPSRTKGRPHRRPYKWEKKTSALPGGSHN